MKNKSIERRRTIRLKRSALLKYGLEAIDRPAIKIAETVEEYQEAFAVLYDAYLECGYIQENDLRQYASQFHFIPASQVFVFKSYLKVIATMTKVEDTETFGLPMDCLYKEELDDLRNQGRKVVEFCAFASPKELRFSNAMVFLKRSMYFQCVYGGINDICIMVNPKHVPYYKEIFLMDDLGPEKTFPKFDAPAVGLRLNIDNYKEDLFAAYGGEDFDTNMHDFFYAREEELSLLEQDSLNKMCHVRSLGHAFAASLLQAIPGLLDGFTDEQKAHLAALYPDIPLAPPPVPSCSQQQNSLAP